MWKQSFLNVSPIQPGGSWKPTDFGGWLTLEGDLAYHFAETLLKIRRRNEQFRKFLLPGEYLVSCVRSSIHEKSHLPVSCGVQHDHGAALER